MHGEERKGSAVTRKIWEEGKRPPSMAEEGTFYRRGRTSYSTIKERGGKVEFISS